jgi:hypothetical protein
VEELIKTMVKEMLEAFMREIYLEQHPTKANGSSTRDLLTLRGLLEELQVSRAREGDFHPLPEKDLPGTFRNHPYSLRCRGKHPEDLRVFGGIYSFWSPRSISHLIEVTQEQGKPGGKGP